MNWKIRGLLGAALAVVLSCGPGKDDAMRLKEGQNLSDIVECPALLCAGPTELCTELLFEYEAPLAALVRAGQHLREAGLPGAGTLRCVIFEGIPFEARCIK